MGVIPQITCRHCGEKFSGLHKRCPHCGAARASQTGKQPVPRPAGTAAAGGKAAAETGKTAKPGASGKKRTPGTAASLFHSDTKWQLLFGCVLIALVIIAVIVLITASLGRGETVDPVETPNLPPVVVTTPPPPTASPTPTPEPTVPVASISVTFLGSPLKEFTQRIGADPIQLKAEVYPVEAAATAKVTWRSADESIVTVDSTGAVTAVGPGWSEVVAECGGQSVSVTVWVPGN